MDGRLYLFTCMTHCYSSGRNQTTKGILAVQQYIFLLTHIERTVKTDSKDMIICNTSLYGLGLANLQVSHSAEILQEESRREMLLSSKGDGLSSGSAR